VAPTPADDTRDVIRAAGGLVWRDGPAGRELLVIHRVRYGDWTLPKGKLDSDERWLDAAVREVREETGYEAEPEGFAGCVCYPVRGVPKVVLYWNMRPRGESRFAPSEEVREIAWLGIEEALGKLAYAGERELLQRNVT
jgi:8-oxo-dGTP pyrophosphatase MutT (NUDIX family)